MRARRDLWQVAFDRSFMHSTDLRPAEKSVILALAGWCDVTLHCDPTKEQIAEGSGVCERQLHGYLLSLKEREYILMETVREGQRNRNHYRLLSRCGICMVRISSSPCSFLKSLSKDVPASPRPPKPRYTTKWKITLFPLPQKPAADA